VSLLDETTNTLKDKSFKSMEELQNFYESFGKKLWAFRNI
jgi:hypothetical protein